MNKCTFHIFITNKNISFNFNCKNIKTCMFSNINFFFSSDILLSDGKYHHLCVTWQSSNGSFVVYVNGTVAFDFTVSGKNLPGGGYWVIGQDQDKVGGKFESRDAFVGVLTEVHVGNRVLSTAEIQDLASSCAHDLIGNYVAYSDFAINGNVSTFQPPCCK
jgi:hypothetical protein